MLASSCSPLHRVSEKNWTLCYFIISLLELELTNEIEFTNEIVLLRDVREVKSTESDKVFQTLTVRCAKKIRRVLQNYNAVRTISHVSGERRFSHPPPGGGLRYPWTD